MTTNDEAKTNAMAEATETVRRRLRLETLDERGRDALDFHDISVGRIRDVITIAFEAGWNAGLAAATPKN